MPACDHLGASACPVIRTRSGCPAECRRRPRPLNPEVPRGRLPLYPGSGLANTAPGTRTRKGHSVIPTLAGVQDRGRLARNRGPPARFLMTIMSQPSQGITVPERSPPLAAVTELFVIQLLFTASLTIAASPVRLKNPFHKSDFSCTGFPIRQNTFSSFNSNRNGFTTASTPPSITSPVQARRVGAIVCGREKTSVCAV